ncbi:MAG TPA: matrixin family metalloprotease [Bryobacteraceae bacterium]|nr:matrixin family metalloprotease [Bryobacteraceae bacterium]
MGGFGRRVAMLAACIAAASSGAFGYYNWVYFASRSGPFVAARFDLNALNNNTVVYFISDQQPSLMQGDSFAAIVSQIRAAADVWNQVPTSTIRVAFGGLSTFGATAQSTPGIDVVFDDNLPPGLKAQTFVNVPKDLSFLANGASFVPILRSKIQLPHDFTARSQYSYADSFFLTVAHEFGHALGLQHTMTSSLMSTDVTRATTKAAPLSPDDMAGISMLYPTQAFLSSTGSISGKVLVKGSAVNLASVVALSTNGVAISAMTNPDGTYTISGLPAGSSGESYYVYAHPLPPPLTGEAYPANIIPPEDMQTNQYPANTGIDTEFFPGTHDWTQAQLLQVKAGATRGDVTFNMQSRANIAIPFAETVGYEGNLRVYSPPLDDASELPIVFYAPGTTVGGNLAPGLGVSVVGGVAQVVPNSLQDYADPYGSFYVTTPEVSSATPVALAFTLPDNLYVLPSAFTIVPNGPPSISYVTPTGAMDALGDPIVNVVGANLGASTRVKFDGAEGTIQSVNSDGSLTVAAPPGNAPYTSSVEALTADGQTSLQSIDAAIPATLTYFSNANPAISVTPANLLPGTNAMVEIDGINTAFVPGRTFVGFGSSDIFVKQVWVTSPTRVVMNVAVSASAQPGSVQVTVACGVEFLNLTAVMQVQTANPRQITMFAPVLSTDTNLAGVQPGSWAYAYTSGLPLVLPRGWTMTVGGLTTTPQLGLGGQLSFQIPSGIPVGPAAVQFISPNGDQIPAVVVQIDGPPPVIGGVANGAGIPIDNNHPAKQGDSIIVTISNLTDSSGNPAPLSRVRFNVVAAADGTVVPETIVAELSSSPSGLRELQVALSPTTPYGPAQGLRVAVDTRESPTFNIAIRPQ